MSVIIASRIPPGAQRRLVATGKIKAGFKTIETVYDNHPDAVAEGAGLPPWRPQPKANVTTKARRIITRDRGDGINMRDFW